MDTHHVKKKEPFESDILHGEFMADLEKLQPEQEVKSLLEDYEDVFGELPAPGTCKKLVQMDL